MSEGSSDSESRDAPSGGSRRQWAVAILLFAATLISTHYSGALYALQRLPRSAGELAHGARFALPLMAILLSHELGHYIAARVHRVAVSPPFFLPVPTTLFGTMGAVIHMPGRIRTRNALFDIGAAGPLAGLAVAIPVLAYGLATSEIEVPPEGAQFEGHSLLFVAIRWLAKGPLPTGTDVTMNATALAGWAGLLVTMVNLLPVGQLDGGHVAYALFGKAQDGYGALVHRALPFAAVAVGLVEALRVRSGELGHTDMDAAPFAGLPWLVWFLVLHVMRRFAGREHPPTDDDMLSPRRRTLAWATLAIFPLTFMPAWMTS